MSYGLLKHVWYISRIFPVSWRKFLAQRQKLMFDDSRRQSRRWFVTVRTSERMFPGVVRRRVLIAGWLSASSLDTCSACRTVGSKLHVKLENREWVLLTVCSSFLVNASSDALVWTFVIELSKVNNFQISSQCWQRPPQTSVLNCCEVRTKENTRLVVGIHHTLPIIGGSLRMPPATRYKQGRLGFLPAITAHPFDAVSVTGENRAPKLVVSQSLSCLCHDTFKTHLIESAN